MEEVGQTDPFKLNDSQWAELRSALGNQRLLGMSYYSGGHLTHGYRHNLSAKMFEAASYDVDRETGLIDYDALRAQARAFRPLVLLAGYSAYPRHIDFRAFREIADEVGAVLMVDMAHFAGLVAGRGVHRRQRPGGARRRGHVDHAQDPARPQGRHGAVHRRVLRARRPRLPDGAGRAAPPRHRRQGRPRSGRPAATTSGVTLRVSSTTPPRWRGPASTRG